MRREFSLRCYAQRQGDLYVAVCVDLSLAAQADTMDEVKRKLDEQISSYLEDLFKGDDRKHMRDLFPRRAPLRFVLRFYAIWLTCLVFQVLDLIDEAKSKKAQAFNEYWPALIPCR